MVRLSQYASNQIQSIVNQYCGYKTRGENGRSAFWLWYDQVKNLIRGITVGSSTRLSNGVYKYTMRYWGDVFFVYSRKREKGRFSGIVITVLDFDFDETNFYNWLQHKPLENHLPPKPNIINPEFKPRPLGFGYTMVKAKSGLYTIADSNGQPLNSNEWFKSILKMRKTAKGEIATFVNKNGFAYAYYPQREKHLEATNKSWNRVYTNESKKAKLTLTESDLRMMVKICIREVLSESEQYYNLRKIGNWDCIPSNGYEFHKIPGKGTCVGIMMYVDRTSKKEILPTYCLFRRGDNGKYFYATIVSSPEDGSKATKFSIVPLKELPDVIYKDRCNLNLQV